MVARPTISSGSCGLRSKVASITVVLIRASFGIRSSVSMGRVEGPRVDMVTRGTRVARKRKGAQRGTREVLKEGETAKEGRFVET